MAKRKTDVANESIKEGEVASFKFSKQQLLNSQKYTSRKDVLNVLLKDGEVYTFTLVDEMIKQFDEGGKK